jgi:hypothetical protein
MPRQIGMRSLSVLVTEKGLAPFVLKLNCVVRVQNTALCERLSTPNESSKKALVRQNGIGIR